MNQKQQFIFDKPESRQYESILSGCCYSEENKKVIELLASSFSKETEENQKYIENFLNKISKTPLASVIFIWEKQIRNDPIFSTQHLLLMEELMQTGFIPLKGSTKQDLMTLEEFSQLDLNKTIDDIRCYPEWSIDEREQIIDFFKKFTLWLCQKTCGYIQEVCDHDQMIAKSRYVSFDQYITILKHLTLRDQILVKFFYLGRENEIEHVLTIKIEDIDFDKNKVLIEGIEEALPKHIFMDIKNYIRNRRSGYLFVSRNGKKISRVTPYRALKKVASKLNLNANFTFKDLSKGR